MRFIPVRNINRKKEFDFDGEETVFYFRHAMENSDYASELRIAASMLGINFDYSYSACGAATKNGKGERV